MNPIEKLNGKKVLLAALAVLSILVVAVYGYTLYTHTFTSSVTEPIKVEVTDQLKTSLYPGESDDLILDITNAATDISYGMTYTISFSGPTGALYTAYIDQDGAGTTYTYTSYTSGTKVTIAGGGEHYLKITVSIPPDGAPGSVSVQVSVDRGAP